MARGVESSKQTIVPSWTNKVKQVRIQISSWNNCWKCLIRFVISGCCAAKFSVTFHRTLPHHLTKTSQQPCQITWNWVKKEVQRSSIQIESEFDTYLNFCLFFFVFFCCLYVPTSIYRRRPGIIFLINKILIELYNRRKKSNFEL